MFRMSAGTEGSNQGGEVDGWLPIRGVESAEEGSEERKDRHARYRMPPMDVCVVGRGKNIRTVVENWGRVAKALHREPAEMCNWFSVTMGVRGRLEGDGHRRHARAVFKGVHAAEVLQHELLPRYISAYILCPRPCGHPETEYGVKDKQLWLLCSVCGCRTRLDMSHRLSVSIVKRMSAAKADQKHKTNSRKDDKRERRRARAERKQRFDASASDDENEHGGGHHAGESKEPEMHAAGVASSESGAVPVMMLGGLALNQLGSVAAVCTLRQQSSESAGSWLDDKDDAMKGKEHEDEDEEDESTALESAISRFRRFLESDQGVAEDATADHSAEVFAELRAVQACSGLPVKDKAIIFMGAVFTEEGARTNEIEQHAEVLKRISNVTVNAADIVSQREVVAGLEWLCGIRFPALVPWFPAMLKQLYDLDVIEEATFRDWSRDTPRNEYTTFAFRGSAHDETLAVLRTAAEPFLRWLAEAESESDDSDNGSDNGSDTGSDSERAHDPSDTP